MRYLVGLLPFLYFLVVALSQCSNDGWEEINNLFLGTYHSISPEHEIFYMRYWILVIFYMRFRILVKYLMEFTTMRSIMFFVIWSEVYLIN